MFDFETGAFAQDAINRPDDRGKFRLFDISKRSFDIVVGLILLIPLAITAIVLLVLNPALNKGPLIYPQVRMGRNCKPFIALKFRSMIPAARVQRGADDPVESDRITRLGAVLRKTRLDELPQVLNVLWGDMSLIGPRPDYIHHARRYLKTVPGYRVRHAVRPGISGLAQTEVGYVASSEATVRKVQADLYYIRNSGFALDTWIFWRTLVVVFRRLGE